MYDLYTMGEEPSNTVRVINEPEAIDVEYIESEDKVKNDLYQRITKQWVIAHEIAGLSIFTTGMSWLFLVFRSINWFPAVISLFTITLISCVLIFSISWGQLSLMNKIRLFMGGIGTGFALAISGSDILYYWFIQNQVLAVSLSVISLLVLVVIIISLLKRKK